MMPLKITCILRSTHRYKRLLYHAAFIAMLSCMVLLQCTAAKLREHYVAGVYLTHDGRLIQMLASRTPGTYQIDGYRVTISPKTEICWHNAPLQFSSILYWHGEPVAEQKTSSPCAGAPNSAPDHLDHSAWLQYSANRYYQHNVDIKWIDIDATRIDIWKFADGENKESGESMYRRSEWKNLCSSASSHELLYSDEGAINVVCDQEVNRYFDKVLSSLLIPSATSPDDPSEGKQLPSVYIVKPFWVAHKYDFESIDGSLCSTSDGSCIYRNPRVDRIIQEIAYAPDDSILIPDSVLAGLNNEAQLAALLSYSLVAADQHLIDRLFRVQRFKRNVWSLSYPKSGEENLDATGYFIRQINGQEVRLGIRRMYRAGYDIRYAPFAWAVEQGKQIKGRVDQPNKHMPWYTAYAFNYINQLYPNVDYSKLKRGEKEYQQFLGELRKADPEAFAPAPPKHAQK